MIDFDIHWTILISLFPNVNSTTFIQIPPPPPKYLCSLLEKQLNFGLYHYNISLNVTAIISRAVNFFFKSHFNRKSFFLFHLPIVWSSSHFLKEIIIQKGNPFCVPLVPNRNTSVRIASHLYGRINCL